MIQNRFYEGGMNCFDFEKYLSIIRMNLCSENLSAGAEQRYKENPDNSLPKG